MTQAPMTKLHRISAQAPDDVSGLAAAIADGRIDPAGIKAVLGKSEGNGLVNDFSRGLAVLALQRLLAEHLPAAQVASVCMVMSGGTEGGMAPHWLVFEKSESDDTGGAPALAIGTAHTPDMPGEHLGCREEAEMVAAGVRQAMKDAGIDRAQDVHFVQIKCPLLTGERIAAVEARGQTVKIRDTLKSMSMSRAASALGVALALGEIDDGAVTTAAIGSDWKLWSGRASTSAGIELLNHEIVVLGMSDTWAGPLAIDHAVMADNIDVEPVRDAMLRLGLDAGRQLDDAERGKLVAVLAKAEASHDGRLRGFRHTMNDDSDISPTRHARAFVAGALGGLVGHAEIFVSGGAEHQGPDGGGPVAVIVDRSVGA